MKQGKLFADSEIYIPSIIVKKIIEMCKKADEKKPGRVEKTLLIKHLINEFNQNL